MRPMWSALDCSCPSVAATANSLSIVKWETQAQVARTNNRHLIKRRLQSAAVTIDHPFTGYTIWDIRGQVSQIWRDEVASQP